MARRSITQTPKPHPVRRLLTYGLTAGLVLTAVAATPAYAAPLLTVTLEQTTGTGPFDADADAGHDVNAANNIVRTNDTVGYKVGVRFEEVDQTNPVITFTLPQGQELVSLPPYCLTGSSVLPALPAPANPVLATSWTTLPQQTVVCRIAGENSATSRDYDFLAKVRPEMPNGTVMGPMTASATTAEQPVPAVSGSVSQVVSAAAAFDLSKRATATTSTNGPTIGYYSACDFDPTRGCRSIIFPITISAPVGGKGVTPLISPITFLDDLSPDALYGPGTTTSAAWIAAGAGALEKYGARLQTCGPANPNLADQTPYSIPNGGNQTTDNSTRNSGTLVCTNFNVAGAVVALTITGADTSAYTVPTKAQTGAGLEATSNYVISHSIAIQVPVDAIVDLGVTNNGTQSLTFSNTFSELEAEDIYGEPNEAEPLANNTRDITAALASVGTFTKRFTGVTGTPANTSAPDFHPGSGYWEGPPGSSTVGDGNTVVTPGQTVISSMLSTQEFPAGTGTTFSRTRVMCDTWDSTQFAMPVTWNQPAIPATTFLSYLASNGSPAYISGWSISNIRQPSAAVIPNLTFQYGFAPSAAPGSATACNTGTWYDNIADVPGASASGGLWSGVNRVRVSFSSYGTISGGQFMVNAATALRVLPTAGAVGTRLPNYASTVLVDGETTMATALSTGVQTNSTYDFASHAGTQGDRVTLGAVTTRLKKYVRSSTGGPFVNTGVPQYTSSNVVEYRLNPTLTADVSSGTTAPVVIEDCLPAFQQFLGSTRANGDAITPAVVQQGAPAGAGLACAADQTYIRWDLGESVVNAVIDPILYTVEISAVARNGNYTNSALVSSTQDPSLAALRTSTAQIQIVTPTGIKIEKSTPHSVVELNPSGATTPRTLEWLVEFSNIDSPTGVSNADVIDVLPANGLGATAFEGTLALTSVSPSSGTTGLVILYTKRAATALAVDPDDASNAAAGVTNWCTAPSGGTKVSGSGTSSDCPAAVSEVTGLRFLRAGSLLPTDEFGVHVVMTPSGNADGDVYDNTTSGRIDGVSQPVGPKNRQIAIVGGSISNFVWIDADKNGLQDNGEAPVAGIPVSLRGTDADGNAISANTTTNSSGNYIFENLPSGTYVVTFDAAWAANEGYAFTTLSTGTDRAIDSDADPTTGATTSIVLAVDEDRTDIDAGLVVVDTSVISLEKVIVDPNTHDSLGDARRFPVTVTCTAPAPAPAASDVRRVWIAADGTPTFVAGIAVGSECSVTETKTDGAKVTYSITSGRLTTIVGDNHVVVTNTFPDSDSTSGGLAFTGSNVALPLGLASLLALFGIGMLAFVTIRRRRTA